MLLGYDHQGFTETYPNGLLVREVRSRLTLPLQSLAGDAQHLLIATRMTLTDVFNAFGLAEVQHIVPDGTLRVIYFAAGYNVATWAERHGVATTNEKVPVRVSYWPLGSRYSPARGQRSLRVTLRFSTSPVVGHSRSGQVHHLKLSCAVPA